jgi:5'-3' exonuclease
MSGRIAIIDGDCLCYRSFEPRWNYNTTPDGNNLIELDADGNKKQKEYTKEEDAAYFKKAYDTLKYNIGEMSERFFCKDFLMAVQGKNNFRYNIFPEYKAKRPNHRPGEVSRFVPKLRELMVLEGLAIPSFQCEADDLIRIWAEECMAIGQDFIIITLDKDLQCIPGKHFVIHKNTVIDVSEQQARYNYYYQLIVGDQIDNIPGIPKVGPKKAEKILEGCTTEDDFQEAVVGAYVDKLGDMWREYLLSNGKLIHLKRHVDDYFDLLDWPIARAMP